MDRPEGIEARESGQRGRTVKWIGEGKRRLAKKDLSGGNGKTGENAAEEHLSNRKDGRDKKFREEIR